MVNDDTDNLYHHGIKGQKWGIRRYQRKDGSLTPAGRKRAEKLESDYRSLTGRNLKKKVKTDDKQKQRENDLYKRKDTKKMTNEELKEKTNRLNLENNYVNAINNYKNLNPDKVSKGKKFVDKIMKDVIVPSATEVAKTQLKNYMNDVLSDSIKNSKKKTKKKK